VLGHFENVARGVVDLRDVLYFLSTTGLFLMLAVGAVSRERLSPGRDEFKRLRVGTAVVAALVITLNLLGSHVRGRLDLTAGNLYTLADGSRELLADLDDLVQIKLFASNELPPELQLQLRDVRDLLADMRRASNGNLVVTDVDPDDDEDAAAEASEFGIFPVEFKDCGIKPPRGTMPSWLETHAPRRFDDLAAPEQVRRTLTTISLSGSPPHLLITGPAGVGKTAAWRLVARQVLGPGWKATAHVLQARDLSGTSGAMGTFEKFLRPFGRGSSDTLAGRTSLEAFDREMWQSSDADDPPPAGVELAPLETGVVPVSRLIVIEDADHLGPKRQPYLRRMMESEAATSRFIFTARAPSRIIDALRSRTQHIRIPAVETDRLDSILKQAAAKEGIKPAAGLIGDVGFVILRLLFLGRSAQCERHGKAGDNRHTCDPGFDVGHGASPNI